MGAPTYRQSQYRDSQDGQYKEKIRELLEIDHRVYDEWELQFLKSVHTRSHTTEKQRAVIDRLYQEKM